MTPHLNRREFLRVATVGAAAIQIPSGLAAAREPRRSGRATIALTLNLEMSRHFPIWGQTHWDFEKGNLDEPNKRYAVEAGRFVKERGARMTYFVIGHTLEQENVEWLEEIHREGHLLANHTYDHVLLNADSPEKLQFKFRRAPWLVEGRKPLEVVEENIRLANSALRHRLGLAKVRGFRASEEYTTGLETMPEVQAMLKRLGFDWVGTKFARVASGPAGSRPDAKLFEAIKASQALTQPFIYPSGLVEIPKGAVGDVGAFRTSLWGLGDYLESVRSGVEWAIENGGFYGFAAHSSVLAMRDPEFKVYQLIFDLAKQAGDRVDFLTMDQVADRTREAG